MAYQAHKNNLDEKEQEQRNNENNAIIFGEYLQNYKNKTQLLIITHKKKTMEYIDTFLAV